MCVLTAPPLWWGRFGVGGGLRLLPGQVGRTADGAGCEAARPLVGPAVGAAAPAAELHRRSAAAAPLGRKRPSVKGNRLRHNSVHRLTNRLTPRFLPFAEYRAEWGPAPGQVPMMQVSSR